MAKVRRISYTDHSVRDLPQRVIVMPDVITVKSFVGRAKASEYNIMRRDWESLEHNPMCANPQWSKSQFIYNHTQQYDSEPGGPCQAERIRDSQRMAIDKGLALWRKTNIMIHVNYDKHTTAIYDRKGNLLQEVK